MAPAHAPSPCSSVSHSRCALPRHWRASCWRDVAASVLLAAALLLLCTRAGAAADQHWCLVMADDRFGAAEVAIAASRTEAEAMDAWQASSPDDLLRAASPWTAAQTGQWTRTNVMLNKLYALATNAGFILVTHETNDRAVAWSKVKLMRELLPMHPECEWLMWLDSDSYVWMDRCLSRGSCANWTLSKVYDTASLSDSTYNAALMEAHRMAVRHGDGVHAEGSASHHWASRDVLLALNGIDTRHYPETEFGGDFNRFMAPPYNFVCSGLFGVRNSAAGAQFLADWWTGDGVPAGDPDAVATAAVEFEKYKTEFPWEQWSLNAMMVPKHYHRIVLYPYTVLGSPLGPYIRHVWTDFRAKWHYWEYGVELLNVLLAQRREAAT